MSESIVMDAPKCCGRSMEFKAITGMWSESLWFQCKKCSKIKGIEIECEGE